MTEENISPVIPLYYQLNNLKQIVRQGWLNHGVPVDKCESVADHSYGTALLAVLTAESYFPQLDKSKILIMSLLHDAGETVTGDLTPDSLITKEEKHRQELMAVRQMFSRIPAGEQYIQLFQEYLEGQTPEAKFVKEIEYLEMAFQAQIYEKQTGINLKEFEDYVRERLQDKKIIELLNEADKNKELL